MAQKEFDKFEVMDFAITYSQVVTKLAAGYVNGTIPLNKSIPSIMEEFEKWKEKNKK